jgi:hypothetical protein
MPTGQPRTSGAAITSIVLGILGCIPGVGLLAIIFGFVGIGTTKDSRYSGRGLAIGGIILGLISLAVWAAIGYGGYWGYGKIKQMADGIKFVESLSKGNVTEAKTYTTGKMSDAELTKLSDTMKTLGELKELKNPKTSMENDVLDVKGTGIFANGTKQVHFVMVKTPTGFKVEKLSLD